MFTLRSPLMVVLLSFVTCGIYGLYWLYKTSTELKYALRNDNNPSLDLILIFVTCGIYHIYLLYRNGKQLLTLQRRFNLPENDTSLINLLLGIFGFGIIAFAITQDEMNKCNEGIPQANYQNQGPEIY